MSWKQGTIPCPPQNRYNHPWRIRPIYMLHLRTSRAQHVTGGMQHWLFDKAVLEDLDII